MKFGLSILHVLASGIMATAQPVSQTVVAEHFTNTYCSVCASRNPGLYSNHAAFPQVLHIAYHPSSPYVACPLNQHNKSENDARANFYGVFGSTPRLLIQAKEVTGSFTTASIFQNELGKTTAFEVSAKLTESAGNIEVRVVVTKKDASSLTNLTLYVPLVEDTLFFAAANGESKHMDVFRKSFWGNTPLAITAPANVGDSIVSTQQITVNSAWNKGRIYAIAILQDGSKNHVQAAKSNKLPYATGIVNTSIKQLSIFPNPSSDHIQLNGNNAYRYNLSITDMTGKVISSLSISGRDKIDVSALPIGTYIVRVSQDDDVQYVKFIKN
ncbi:hypothetical protein CAP35_08965 [Chitinophagaceae bacterium IBVUCB1]|nr:hypothetical protein CAP35_08965 [Chitinophagaceae bacterium IBVUCB1]